MLKSEKIILSILKGLIIILCLGGALAIYGSVGACENDHITMLQCLVQSILSGLVIVFAFVLFGVRETLKEKCLNRIESKKEMVRR
jgi:hypothetical protein